jgi:hypothetical protein
VSSMLLRSITLKLSPSGSGASLARPWAGICLREPLSFVKHVWPDRRARSFPVLDLTLVESKYELTVATKKTD